MTESPAKPCPFCDCKPIVYTRESGETAVECATRHGCPMSAGWTLLEDWNRRPIEDALRAEIERLKSQLLQRDAIWLPAKDAEIERLRAALEEIHRLPLAKETRPDMPYSLIANIDAVAKEALEEGGEK